MKKIGLLFGKEQSFPLALIERINQAGDPGILAEPVMIHKVLQGEPTEYAVILDRISQDIPFYRSYLKNAALCGTAVINNPFWWSADEKFFNNALATRIGVPVPKTVLIPSRDQPQDTSEQSFRNLAYPLDWDSIFNYVGFPAYMKPYAGGGWKHVYKLHNREEFFHRHAETGQLVMMLQEEIIYEQYYRCYCIGGQQVRVMPYNPKNQHHERYQASFTPSGKLLELMEHGVRRLNTYLGYDFNSVEFAVRDGIPYAIDFCNPAPDADLESVGPDHFAWVLETAASYALDRARSQDPAQDNLTWGTFLRESLEKKNLLSGSESKLTGRSRDPKKPSPKPAGRPSNGSRTPKKAASGKPKGKKNPDRS